MSLFAEYRPGAGGSTLPGLELRPAEEGDAAAIAQLCARREGQDVRELLPRIERETRGEFPRAEQRLLVAHGAGRLVGFGRSKLFRPPPDSTPRTAPAGWYLGGVIVAPELRRRGVGRALCAARLGDLFPRASEVYYLANARNLVSRDLHASLGFEELTRDFEYPNVSFAGGVGVLYRLDRATYERLTRELPGARVLPRRRLEERDD